MDPAAVISSARPPLKIVRLDGIHIPRPNFTIPHVYTEYSKTTVDEVPPRIADADVIITTTVPLSASDLSPSATPNLKLVSVLATGTDIIDLRACERRSLPVCNVPAGSNESVAQHAVSMFLALRRRIPLMNELVLESRMWGEKGTCTPEFGGVPRGWSEEVVGIVGAGDLGNQIAAIVKALGMAVLFADRKGLEARRVRKGRVSFEETLRKSTVLMLTCPLTAETRGMIDTPEFELMSPDSLVVNVARGSIMVEETLVEALKSGRIAGAATDVFESEPATRENSVLVREGSGLKNLIMSPHVAWYCRSSMAKVRQVGQENIEAFWNGKPQNLVVSKTNKS